MNFFLVFLLLLSLLVLNLSFLNYITSAIIFILIGGIFPLLERKKLSTIQRRVGPKFSGYNGRLQFVVDALKIFFKDYFYLNYVNKNYFYLIPLLSLFLNMLFLINFQ